MASTKRVNLVESIMRYEEGEMSETETEQFFQHIVETGAINALQGSYGRTAAAMIAHGVIQPPQ